jgi:hypothetical protein
MWLHHGNVGYLFPDRAHVKFTAGPQEGRWSDIGTGSKDLVRRDVFNLWIDHGVRPQRATYSYQVFPGISAEQMPDRAKGSGIDVLENAPTCQAVRCARLGLTAIAFWKAGSVGSIAVDQPCLLLVRQRDGKTTVTAANPENRTLALHVRVDGREVELNLPDGAMAGSSFTRELGAQ